MKKMKKMKKALIMGITTVMLGMNFLSSGIIENLPKIKNLEYAQAYKHNADNILENVFENNGLTILPFIFENSDQTITKDYLIKQFEKAGLKVENQKELESIIVTGNIVKTASKVYTVLIYGDVNKDGYVDVFDADAVFRHDLYGRENKLSGIYKIAGNVYNEDDVTDVFDAQQIFEFDLKLITKLVLHEPEGSKIPDDPEKEKPEYTVPTGLKAIYGQTLNDVKLPEGFTFEDDLKTSVGDVGTNKFKVTYTPKDTDKYEIVTGIEVEIVVTKPDDPEKEKPEYTVPTGLKATYGQTLNDVKLPEGFTFEDKLTTKVGNAGTNTFKVTYTPEDTDKFQIVTGIEVEIEVLKAVLTEGTDYTVPTNLKAAYGDKLKDVTGLTEKWKFVKEDGTDASEELVGNVNAEGNEFKLQFIPTDGVENYEKVIVTVKVVVEKAEPKDVPELRTLRKAKGTLLKDIELPAGWAFKDTSDTATIGDTVNLNGKEFDVIYTPSDPNSYKTKEGKVLIIVVAGKLVEGTDYIVPTNLKATYGDKLKDVTGTGLTSQWKFIKEDGTDASEEFVGNANLTGNEFKIQFIPTDGVENYEEVIKTVKVVVEKAEPQNVPALTTLTKPQGTYLKDIELPTGWAFVDTSETATVGEPNAEGNEIPVIYTSPITPENYKTKDGTVKIIVIKPLLTVTASIPNKKAEYYCGDKITIEVASGANEEKITNLNWEVTKTNVAQGENGNYTEIANVEIKETKADGTIVLEFSIDEAGTYEFKPIAENAGTNTNITPVNIVVKNDQVVDKIIFTETQTTTPITNISINAQKEKTIDIEFKNKQDIAIDVDVTRIIDLLKINGKLFTEKTENGALVLTEDGIEITLLGKTTKGEYYTINNKNSSDEVKGIAIKPVIYYIDEEVAGGKTNARTLTVGVKNTDFGIENVTNKEEILTINVLQEMPKLVKVTTNPSATQPNSINLYLGSSLAEANVADTDKVVPVGEKLYTILPIYLHDGEESEAVTAGSLSNKLTDGEIHIVDNITEAGKFPCITFQRFYSADGVNFTAINEKDADGNQVSGFSDMEVNYIGIAINNTSFVSQLNHVRIYNDEMTENIDPNTDKITLTTTVVPTKTTESTTN